MQFYAKLFCVACFVRLTCNAQCPGTPEQRLGQGGSNSDEGDENL